MQFLLDKFGTKAIVEFFSYVNEYDIFDDLKAPFKKATGQKLETVIASFDSDRPDFAPNPGICLANEVSWSNGIWSVSTDFGCADSRIINYFEKVNDGVNEKRLYTVTLNIETAGAYVLAGANGVETTLAPCFCDARTYTRTTSTPKTVDLEVGRYRLYMLGELPKTTSNNTYSVTLRPE